MEEAAGDSGRGEPPGAAVSRMMPLFRTSISRVQLVQSAGAGMSKPDSRSVAGGQPLCVARVSNTRSPKQATLCIAKSHCMREGVLACTGATLIALSRGSTGPRGDRLSCNPCRYFE